MRHIAGNTDYIDPLTRKNPAALWKDKDVDPERKKHYEQERQENL